MRRIPTGLRALVIAVLTVAAACSSSRSQENVSSTSQAVVSSNTARVLSFEQPTTDWTASGLNLQQGNLFVDGQHSAEVTVINNGGELISVPLSSLGPISSTVTLQVRLPAYVASTTWQGQVALHLNSPTAGVFTQYFGPAAFSNSSTGVFHQAQFTLPPAIQSALSTKTYSDLTVSIELDFGPNPNTNAGFSDPFYIDKLDFGQVAPPPDAGAGGTSGGGGTGGKGGAGGGTGAGGTTAGAGAGGTAAGGAGAGGSSGTAGTAGAAGTAGVAGTAGAAGTAGSGNSGPCSFTAAASGSSTDVPFVIKLPVGVHREEIGVGTTGGYLTLDDGVTVVKDAGGFASVSSVAATNRTNLGVAAQVQDVYTEATGIDLRSNAHVHGTLKTAADFTTQAGAMVDGNTLQNTSLQPLESITWTASFPNTNQGSCSLEPDNAEVIVPGSYGDIAVKSRSHLKIRSGTYYFNSLSFEPQAELDIDNTAGPVFIYIRTTFAFSGTVVEADTTHMNFLFGVAGSSGVNIQTAFRGILVAPSAGVSLPTDSNVGHVGAFFANAFIAHQNTALHQRPFSPAEFCASNAACSSFCPCGDNDVCGGAPTSTKPTTADPNCIDGVCCPAGANVITLTPGADTYNNSTASSCLLALAGNDTLSSAAPGVTVVGGLGDDTIAAGQFSPPGTGAPPVRIFGGPGNDTINGWFDGAQIYGGSGDDTISAGPGPVLIAPGSGVDNVSSGDGDDTFVLFAECEATPGKKLIANGGFNTLISPLSIDELTARGVTVEGFENVIIQSDACKSDCTVKPNCGPGTQCADRDGQAVCGGTTGSNCSTCSDCAPGLTCTTGTCQVPIAVACTPNCSGKTCGSDGCGGTCGSLCALGAVGCTATSDCTSGMSCDSTGRCLCTPSCDGKKCGDDPSDGCGGTCFSLCANGQAGCKTDLECPLLSVCGIQVGQYFGLSSDANVCWPIQCSELDTTQPGSGVAGAQCGSLPACVPQCTGKSCGGDGCGGQCGACDVGSSCSPSGQCTPTLNVAHAFPPGFPTPLAPATTVPVGALQGSFAVSNRGSATYSIPIIVPPGRLGLQPHFSFAYQGNKTDGLMGPGWKIAGLSAIERCTRTVAQDGYAAPVTFTSADMFCMDGARLVGTVGNYGEADSEYSTEIDTFAKIRLVGPTVDDSGAYVGPTRFDVFTKSGEVLSFGSDPNSIVIGARSVGRLWALDLIKDRLGNSVQISYVSHKLTGQAVYAANSGADTGEMLPDSVTYGGNGENNSSAPSSRWLSFHYTARSDYSPPIAPRYQYVFGAPTFSEKNLDSVEVHTTETLVRRYELSYAPDLNGNSHLGSIRECVPDASSGKNVCLSPTQFDYGPGGYVPLPVVSVYPPGTDLEGKLDMDGDGRDDLIAKLGTVLGVATRPWDVHKTQFAGETYAGTAVSIVGPQGQMEFFGPMTPDDINRDGKDDFVFIGDVRDSASSTAGVSDGDQFTTLGVSVEGVLADVDGDGIADLVGPEDVARNTGVAFGASTRFAVDQDLLTASFGDFFDGGLLPLDLDGDGADELLYLAGSGKPTPADGELAFAKFDHTAQSMVLSRPFAAKAPAPSSRIKVMDFNGDGLKDILELRPVKASANFEKSTGSWWLSRAIMWINTGGGFSQPLVANECNFILSPDIASGDDILPNDASFDNAVVIDYDGDGLDDLVVPQSGNTFATLYRSVANVQAGFGPTFNVSRSGIRIDLTGLNQVSPRLIAADMNGDGSQDIVFNADDGLHIFFGQNGTAGLLTAVTDGLGKFTAITYAGAAAYSTTQNCFATTDATCVHRAFPVVSEDQEVIVGLSTGEINLPGPRHDYTYSDARVGLGGRGSYGFGARSVQTFDANGVLQQTTRQEYINDSFALAGLVNFDEVDYPQTSQTEISAVQHLSSTVEYSWTTHQSTRGQGYPALDEVLSSQFDTQEDSGSVVTRDTKFLSRNGYGDVEDVTTVTQVLGSGTVDSAEVTTTHKNFEPSWLIGRPDVRVATDMPVGATAVSRTTQYVFDLNGLIHQVFREPGDAILNLETRYDRDSFGNITSVHSIDPSGVDRTVSFGFDDNRQIYPTSMTDPRGTSSIQFDDTTGNLLSFSDWNGVTTQRQYDGFGRLCGTEAPGSDIVITYASAGAEPGPLGTIFGSTQVQTSVAGGTVNTVTSDAFGRRVKVLSTGLKGALISKEYSYDSMGRVQEVTAPHLPGDASQGFVDYQYDEAGRLSFEFLPDSSRIEHLHASVLSALGDAKNWLGGAGATRIEATVLQRGNVTAEVFDPRGRPLTTVEASSISGSQETHLTQSTYGAFGTLHTVTDPFSNVTTTIPDRLGRIVEIDDPDMGMQTRQYSAWGEITQSTNGRGETTHFTQDTLGRLRTETDDVGQLIAKWDYDGGGDNEIGRLVSTFRQLQPHSDDGITTVYQYEPKPPSGLNAGRLQGIQETLQDETGSSRTLKTVFSYDSFGRVDTTSYPLAADSEAFVVRRQYDVSSGALAAVCDGASANCDISPTVFWRLTAADQGFRPSLEQFGDGSTTARTFYSIGDASPDCQVSSSGRSCLPGQLESIVTTETPGTGGTPDLSLTYHYDRNQNVAAIDGSDESSFEYDLFDRLQVAHLRSGDVTYGHDAIGNLTSQTGLPSYVYPVVGAPQPHALQSVGATTFMYDANGDQIVREGDSIPGGFQRIDYNDFDMPYRIAASDDENAAATTLEYTAAGVRAAKRGPVGTTLYMGDLYERHVDTGSTDVIHRYKVFALGQLVAQVNKTESSAQVTQRTTRYVHGDILGSARLITGGESPESRDFSPLGQPSDLFSQSNVDAGFTGDEHDAELGFVNMRGRLYDPQTGRFITPDPSVQSFAAQDLNRYSYAHNNPLKYTDPSGFMFRPNPFGIGNASGITLTPGNDNGDNGGTTTTPGDSDDEPLDLTGAAEYAGQVFGASTFGGTAGGDPPPGSDASGDWSGNSPGFGSGDPGTSATRPNVPDERIAQETPPAPEPRPGEVPPRPGSSGPNAPQGANAPPAEDPIDPDAPPPIFDPFDLPPDLQLQLIRSGGTTGGATLVNPGEEVEGAPIPGSGGVADPFAPCTQPSLVSTHYTAVDDGPLSPGVAGTFRGGSYTANPLTDPLTLYRVWGGNAGPVGSFWTRTSPLGPTQAIIDLALNPLWGNTGTNVSTITVPAGVTIYEGFAAPQGGLVGGGNQVFIPVVDVEWLFQ